MADVAEGNRKIVPLSMPEMVIPEVLINAIPDWIYEGNITIVINILSRIMILNKKMSNKLLYLES